MRIPGALRQAILKHVLACLPEEACGLVGGDGKEARRVIAVENELHSPTQFRMRGLDQLRAFQSLDAEGLELAAIFHSHPAGPEVPSATDLDEFNYPGVLTLIWSPRDGTWEMRAFMIEGKAAREVLVEE